MWVLPIVIVILAVAAATSWLLLLGVNRPPLSSLDLPSALTDPPGLDVVLFTALLAGTATGALAVLGLAFRRQRHRELDSARAAYEADRTARHAERVADAAERDAAERRITDLYVRAAEQLGHAQPAVRLAGLYGLERLAEADPGHRQTVVNLLCAYLRMPYHPGATGNGREGELQVRLTAQGVLANHLRENRSASPGSFWAEVRLDLTGATLIDPDFSSCTFGTATFTRAVFAGNAEFSGATFERPADFSGAAFNGSGWFGGVTFDGTVRFRGATFSGAAGFGGTSFNADAWFRDVTFGRHAGFARAIFSGQAGFDGGSFEGEADLREAVFAGDADFGGASFARDADFSRASFMRTVRFADTAFTSALRFEGAIASDPDQAHVWPSGWHPDRAPEGPARLVPAAS
ncbi:pentapeptide repeat-containing protein [Spongiactinospora sp. TRM90649]|uniref:pentapeptide repeat-containing protein n=1 Tax=Spongiactinospora sp. TRM90649 TaxID=3031114 RepID=UPI0023F98F3F|nr:pentapeptide repeat-containing protein [Spongiactinospora sp. TRM90649]MDF5757572.1 pentapeptide repeat-containing protein [Spongiactinospora sp. TRM90649]